MIPVSFGDCFGWFHAAEGGRAVVICPAFGVEELCTHRFMRRLAEQLAAAGMPTLRFDYQGTGNSKGTDLDPDRVTHWLASIRGAIEWLRADAGVQEVCLVGFRLGGLLASHLAAQHGGIQKLVLLAPAISGKTYLREVKALSMVIAQSARAFAPTAVRSTESDVLEVAGFLLTRECVTGIEQLDLLALGSKPANQVIILGRPAVTAESRLATRLRELGCDVEQGVLPGYAEMEWNSSLAALPDNAFTDVVRWIARDQPQRAASLHASAARKSGLYTEEWREEPVLFGKAGQLFGIQCVPTRAASSYAVLFVNHGANHHIGWARTFVKLARRFAAKGIPSFRIDVAGIGDSPTHAGQTENQLYYRGSQNDVYAALDWMYRQGYTGCTLVGHCAGAYLGFYSAIHDSRITGLVLLNLQRFFWRRGDSLEIVMRSNYRSTDWYLSNIFDIDVWKRALRGNINFLGIAKAITGRLLNKYGAVLGKMPKDAATGHGKHKVLEWFRRLSDRGTKVLLVYSAEDGGLDELALHGGSGGKRIRKLPNVEFRIIDGADHNITSPWAYDQYAKILDDYFAHEHKPVAEVVPRLRRLA